MEGKLSKTERKAINETITTYNTHVTTSHQLIQAIAKQLQTKCGYEKHGDLPCIATEGIPKKFRWLEKMLKWKTGVFSIEMAQLEIQNKSLPFCCRVSIEMEYFFLFLRLLNKS